MKAQWERKEYLKTKKDLAELEGKPHSPFIFCSHCRKEVRENIIQVVDFGKKIACGTCFTKHWSKIRNRIAKLQVPAALQDAYEQQEDSEEYKAQVESDRAEALKMQQAEMDRIRNAGR